MQSAISHNGTFSMKWLWAGGFVLVYCAANFAEVLPFCTALFLPLRCSATRFLIKRDKIFEKNLVPLGGVIGSKNATKSPLTCADRPPRGGAARVKERVF